MPFVNGFLVELLFDINFLILHRCM